MKNNNRYDLTNLCIELGIALKRDCDFKKVILKTTNTTTISYPQSGFNCSGYFIAFPGMYPLMGFAMGIEINDLIPTILHEWSHMDQWFENNVHWENNMHFLDGKHKESVDIISEWINGKNIDNIDVYIENAISIELDCEMRTIEKMKSFHIEDKLKYTIEEYIQKANSYIFLYLYIKEKRSWNITGQAPYLLENVWKKFPTNFNNDYTQLTNTYRDLYDKYCYS